MPPHESIGEAVAKQWVIRDRLIQGFGVWQQVFAAGMSGTDPFLLSADSIGELISNIYLLRPLQIPEEWTKKIVSVLDDAAFAVEKQSMRASADADTQVVVAEKKLDIKTSMAAVSKWAELADG